MEINPIHNEADYKAALLRVEALMDAEADAPESDELDILATLIVAYEEKNHPIEEPDPVEFLKNAMELMGHDQSALADLLHSRPRASEILNRQRRLTLNQIRAITSEWNLPADPLIQEY